MFHARLVGHPFAGSGDSLRDGAGNDLVGSRFTDFLRGGDGNDDLRGDDGNDELRGDAGNDRVRPSRWAVRRWPPGRPGRPERARPAWRT